MGPGSSPRFFGGPACYQRAMSLLWTLVACWGAHAYIVEGTVVELRPPSEVVLDHEDVPGLMGPMIMPFAVADPAMLDGLKPGTRVVARYELGEVGGKLTRLRITGQLPAPEVVSGPMPVRPGAVFPATSLQLQDGSTWTLGAGQAERVALTFLYTRCPQPEFCPAMVARLQALQEALAGAEGARIVAVTLDPDHDTPEVLSAYAAQVGAGPGWRFGRVPAEALPDLALLAGMNVMRTGDGAEIAHALRLLVLDRGGALIERYDDARFPLDRVVEQLTTGGPPMPPGNSGTVTPPEAE